MDGFCRRLLALLLLLALGPGAHALERIAREPYVGAIVIDAATGRVLLEDGADTPAYPASVTKLMTFAVVMDRIEAGQLALDSRLTVSAEAARTGGSQVYLKQGEVFSVDEMLIALLVSSANDAAVALAGHAAGSRAAFVELMNAKARALGMTATQFNSPHGLPPGAGQRADVSTARDLAVLSRELVRRGRVLPYSSIRVRMLREQTANPFEMRNHNNLLGKLAGCDGLKTGYFHAAGSSIAATVERNGRRIIVVVLGSATAKMRDLKTMELAERGFAALGDAPVAAAPVSGGAPAPAPAVFGSLPDPAGPLPTVRTEPEPAPMEPGSTPAEPAVKFHLPTPATKR